MIRKIITSLYEALFPRPFNIKKIGLLPRGDTPAQKNFYSLFNYQSKEVKILIRYIKNNRDFKLSQKIAQLMSQELLNILGEQQLFGFYHRALVIAVPASAKTRKARGFNQVDLISKYLAGEIPRALCKNKITEKKETSKQALLEKRSRKKNIKGAFIIRDKKIIDRADCIIVDDLVTTGATMNELRHTLLKAGARKVISISIAH